MFRKFSKESIKVQNQVKSSVQRSITSKIVNEFPLLEALVEEIAPRKEPLMVVKCQNHLNLICANGMVLFFQERDGPFVPTLRMVHKYPGILPTFVIDRGAIRPVLGGANVMAPGLQPPRGSMDDVEQERLVAVVGAGKKLAMAVGVTKMSTAEIIEVGRGVAVEVLHVLGDGLFQTDVLS